MTVTAASTLDELWAEHHRLERVMDSHRAAADDVSCGLFDEAAAAWREATRLIAIHEAVRRGIAHLDRTEDPGWRDRLTLSTLHMGESWLQPDGCGCVYAQLHGCFSPSVTAGARPDRLGFDLGDYAAARTYDELTDAWRVELASATDAAVVEHVPIAEGGRMIPARKGTRP